MARDDGVDDAAAVAQLLRRVDALHAAVEEKETRIHELEQRMKKATVERVYITTATTSDTLMGHAFANVTSDAMARYHRIFGREVFLLAGTDEYDQKLELGNKSAATCLQLAQDLDMYNDGLARTTSAEHKKCAQWLFQRVQDAGDVYLGMHEGWYHVLDETFVTEMEAQQTNYKDPATGVPYKKMKEASYFIEVSKYQERLIRHVHINPEFLQPEECRQEILRRLKEPLQDVVCAHGVSLLNDSEHVMYVWFDALVNYLSTLDYPCGENAKFWPASVQIVGKNDIWCHCVVWPCILMSAGLPLPKRVFAHDFVNAKDGTKMSESVGNVVNPYDIMSKFGLDSFRYFLIRGAPYGQDTLFLEGDLINIHNSELADTLGNLVHRVVNICQKYSEGVVPAVSTCDSPFDVHALLHESEVAYKDIALQNACLAILGALRVTNRYLTDKAPWHMKQAELRHVVVRTCLEAIYVLAHYLSPIMPATADKIFAKLGKGPVALLKLSPNFDNLTPGTPVMIGDVLFAKVLSEEALKMQKESAKAKAAPKPAKAEKAAVQLFTSLDIRVGEITRVWEHPDSDTLYCEEIDVGIEEGPKQIGSDLRPFYTLQQMQGRKVLVLLNLKPANLGSFKSHGMVLCASDESHEHVEFIEPPAGAKVGERVFIDTESGEPLSAAQLQERKVWDRAAIYLLTNDEGVATFKGNVIKTSAGPCRAKSLSKARQISPR